MFTNHARNAIGTAKMPMVKKLMTRMTRSHHQARPAARRRSSYKTGGCQAVTMAIPFGLSRFGLDHSGEIR